MTDSVSGPAAGLVAVKAQGHHLVHLATAVGGTSLCGRLTRARPPGPSFRISGCHTCLNAALSRGFVSALDGDQSWINLSRVQLSTR